MRTGAQEKGTVMSSRLEKLRHALSEDDLESLIVAKGSDIKYLTGFSGEYGSAVLVVTPDECHLVTDNRYVTQVERECPGVICHSYSDAKNRPSGLYKMTGEVASDLGLAKAGFVGADITFGDYQGLLTYAGPIEFTPVHDYVADLRAIKEPGEIELIREAARITMRSFYAILDEVRPGKTEADIANALEREFRARGGQGFCFETIVASGPDNGACPHATASDRKLEYGDFVTIDFGTYYKDYTADITRTVVIGKAKEPKLYDIWKIVEESKLAGAEAVKPGATFRDVHEAVTGVVEAAGYKIPHGVGHCMGMDNHEFPYVGPYDVVERPGMIHTIEPGIYVPGLGGVRQEDDYLVTEDGHEQLTYITEHLIEL